MTTWFEALTDWILSNLNSIGLLVIGSFLTLFSSWFVARYTWKRQKDDERRARVYAPLYDELSNLKHSLAKYGHPETKEYDQISSTHLLYLVPHNLQAQMRELYNQKLRHISAMNVKLEQKYKRQILEHMYESCANSGVLNDPDANGLADDISIYLIEGKIDEGKHSSMERVFQSLRSRFGFGLKEKVLEELFERFHRASSEDKDMVGLIELREQSLQLIDSIQNAIRTDLETRFWFWLHRILRNTEK